MSRLYVVSKALAGVFHIRFRGRGDSSVEGVLSAPRLSARWAAFLLPVLCASVLAMTWMYFKVRADVGRAQAELQQALAASASAATSAPAPAVSTNFVDTLPMEFSDVDWAQALAAQGRAQNVRLLQLEFERASDDAATNTMAAELNRTRIRVSLQGAYPALKAALAGWLGDHPEATLDRLSLRRTGAPEALEASVVVSVWTRHSASAVTQQPASPAAH